MLPRDDDKLVFTVSELAGAARFTLEERFPMVWVEGELSNLRAPGCGPLVLHAEGRRRRNCAARCSPIAIATVRFKPRDGMQVILRGRVSFYEARGDFQLLADHLEAVRRRRAARRVRCAETQARRRRSVRRRRASGRCREFPTHVAVISSRSGAALRDIVVGAAPPLPDLARHVARRCGAGQGRRRRRFSRARPRCPIGRPNSAREPTS